MGRHGVDADAGRRRHHRSAAEQHDPQPRHHHLVVEHETASGQRDVQD